MRFPDDTNRHAIIGATGSGKTQAAIWHLSLRSYDRMPWLIFNFKTDQSIDGIPHARMIGVEEIPVKPGVYIVHPSPQDTESVETQMWHIWQHGNIGVYIDEGYMVGNHNAGFRALLTQGRSKRVPMIVLSQRPVWMDRFVFSESEFYQVFRLQHKQDVKNVSQFVPAEMGARLPDYHSWYYDVGRNQVTVLKPVPLIEEIYTTFDRRLKPVRKVL